MSTCNAGYFRRRRSNYYVNNVLSSEVNLVPVSESCEKLPGISERVKVGNVSKFCALWGVFKGFFYTFLCSLFITLSSVIVKKIVYIDSGELSMIRNAGVFLGCLPIVFYSGNHPLGPRNSRLLLLIRGFLGATALYLSLLAYRLLPLAEAAIIQSSLPALVMVMARIFLNESCGVVQCLALVVTLTGVLLSLRIPVLIAEKQVANVIDMGFISGICAAIGCVLLLSITFVAVRKMKDIHYSVVLIYLGFLGVLENAGLTSAFGSFSFPRCGADVAWVLMIAVFGCLGHIFLTVAIQAEAVGIVSVTKASIDIITAMVFQNVFFEEPLDIYNYSGAALVILSVGIIGFRKWLSEKPDSDTIKQKLRFFLV